MDIKAIGTLVSQGGWTPQQYRAFIAFFLKTKQWQEAEDVLNRALEEYPGSPALHATYGDILAARERYEEAREKWFAYTKKFSRATSLFEARLAWLALRLGDNKTARDIIAQASSKDNSDIFICKFLVNPKLGNLDQKNLKDGTEVIVDYAHLVHGLARGNPNEINAHYPYAWISVAVWCPEAIPQAIALFYKALSQGKKIQENVVNILGPDFPIVLLEAIRSSNDLRFRQRLLRKGLEWHPDNKGLLNEYTSDNPKDDWLLKHIENHRLKPSANIIESLNAGSTGGKFFSPSFLATYKHGEVDLELNALGGGDGIGDSAYVLTYKGKSLLLDCGLNPQKKGPEAYPDLDRWLGDINAIIVSHGHLDHCGALPKAHNRWPQAPIFCTKLTKDFATLLFGDMLRIRRLEYDRETYADTIEREEMDSTLKSIRVIPFGEWVEVFPDCRIRLHKAGHIPGAAITEIVWCGLSIVYTGDFCLHDQRLMKGASLAQLSKKPDLLICEATYAGKFSGFTWEGQLQELRQAIMKTLNQRGSVLLPSFAVGRSQELVFELADLADRELLPNNPALYISGLAYEACRRLAEIDRTFGDKMKRFKYLRPEDYNLSDCSITIASSGMLVSGSASARIADKLRKASCGGIFFCGYLDEEVEKENNLIHDVNSGNVRIARYSLSAHASSQDLIKLITFLHPSALVLVHWGENDPDIQENFLEQLRLMVFKGDCLTWIPQRNSKISPCSAFYWLKNRLKGAETYVRR